MATMSRRSAASTAGRSIPLVACGCLAARSISSSGGAEFPEKELNLRRRLVSLEIRCFEESLDHRPIFRTLCFLGRDQIFERQHVQRVTLHLKSGAACP